MATNDHPLVLPAGNVKHLSVVHVSRQSCNCYSSSGQKLAVIRDRGTVALTKKHCAVVQCSSATCSEKAYAYNTVLSRRHALHSRLKRQDSTLLLPCSSRDNNVHRTVNRSRCAKHGYRLLSNATPLAIRTSSMTIA